MESLEYAGSVSDAYPERGWKAYGVVLGAWFVLFPASGLLNSTGIFQAWLLENDLNSYTESEVAWIFSLFAFLFFFGGFFVGTVSSPWPISFPCSPKTGPLFDKFGSKILLPTGSVGVVTALICTSFCKSMYPIQSPNPAC